MRSGHRTGRSGAGCWRFNVLRRWSVLWWTCEDEEIEEEKEENSLSTTATTTDSLTIMLASPFFPTLAEPYSPVSFFFCTYLSLLFLRVQDYLTSEFMRHYMASVCFHLSPGAWTRSYLLSDRHTHTYTQTVFLSTHVVPNGLEEAEKKPFKSLAAE